MVATTDELTEDTKTLAVDMLNTVLRDIGDTKVAWKHHLTLGFNAVVSNIDLEIADPRYGMVTDFDYNVLADKDNYEIILYFRPGCGVYGYGVLSEDCNVCLEITTADLIEWIVPTDTENHELPERVAQMHALIGEAQRLTT